MRGFIFRGTVPGEPLTAALYRGGCFGRVAPRADLVDDHRATPRRVCVRHGFSSFGDHTASLTKPVQDQGGASGPRSGDQIRWTNERDPVRGPDAALIRPSYANAGRFTSTAARVAAWQPWTCLTWCAIRLGGRVSRHAC